MSMIMLGPFQFLVKLLKTEISNLGNNTFKKVKQNCVFFYFLILDFLDPIAQNLMNQSLPKFQDW